ncbi:MAG: cell division protein FtsZ [Chitinophagaceae bacterium]|nr:cell division protein FtsZ [Chitinophagaceae bacterium]
MPKQKSSILKVIGVGGGGSNAVNYMYQQGIEGVDFVICNTDAQSLSYSNVPNRIQLGPTLTQGLGAGANPDIGRQATEESLEEIRKILEVNTKMAFITAGMGGGTGTGGAPIIAKLCRDMGILTVGIVTTPFSYEGKKRQQQAEEGIKNLKQYVDTLLVICNDKLRYQYGNLKMREAFAKADNVLATAARCITDVINSTGQINLDFADVCTVMRNGGVAILGHATASGEGRAQKAVEEALNSPLLNDNDIRGAKWILINITSASGEHEFTVDEVEVIQSYLLSRAGENTDVIVGMGYDNNMSDELGITLIATGFEHKNPFEYAAVSSAASTKEEKIILELKKPEESVTVICFDEETKQKQKKALEEREMHVMEECLKPAHEPQSSQQEFNLPDYLVPVLHEIEDNTGKIPEPASVIDFSDMKFEETEYFELYTGDFLISDKQNNKYTIITAGEIKIDTGSDKKEEKRISQPAEFQCAKKDNENTAFKKNEIFSNSASMNAASGGYLTRPTKIYEDSKEPEISSKHSAEEAQTKEYFKDKQLDEYADMEMKLVEREQTVRDDMLLNFQISAENINKKKSPTPDELSQHDMDEEMKKKAEERLKRLRNLSFNINMADPNNEFETIPAYIRRNMELYNLNTNIEKFYSRYEIKTNEKNETQISTINTFLDGKKPD